MGARLPRSYLHFLNLLKSALGQYHLAEVRDSSFPAFCAWRLYNLSPAVLLSAGGQASGRVLFLALEREKMLRSPSLAA